MRASGSAGLPRAPLLLGAAGLVPFLWGALTAWAPALDAWGAELLGPRWTGREVLLSYGVVILAFMAGTIWGFATREGGDGRGPAAAWLFGLSVLPALWAWAMGWSGLALIVGFLGLLPLDWRARARGVAPSWWLRLRLPLTAGVVLCLLLALP
ncbi:DUF3429 domain-containing protein [Rubellimicrobium sp. CFH 75288]|uniref:DUF3429 domain-containing protein n=1 Tax=Rubellimicrobium sp. CFH 75288 TaxID=2697034 RepID=UPI00141330EC|nr:DUF3429 domain-containing protein [Rubellimicrobium sp. CFH 75288]NAZ38077.1 DUF3429 family protein [Rubellimicrobium sp. CFH 75288]